MTHQEMITFVSEQLRNTKIDSLITSWLNLSAVEFANSYEFGHLNTYSSKNTSAGVPDVTLDTDFHWLKTIQIPADNRTLYPESDQYLAKTDPDYRTEQGEVVAYYLNGLTLGLWKVPSGVKTITYSYQRKPVALVATTDVSELPDTWHEVICQSAISKGFVRQRDGNAKVDSDRRIKELLKLNKASLFKRPDYPLNMGRRQSGYSKGQKPGRPTFPDHIG